MPSTLKRQSVGSPSADDPLRLHSRTYVRRPLVAVASLLLVVVSVAVFANLYAHAGGRVSVLAVAHDVALGQVIEADDVATARISVSSGLSTIPAREVGDVVGQRAEVDLERGTLLAFDELGGRALPSGKAIVGVATKLGELPAEGVTPGESVEVVLTDPAGDTGQAETTQGSTDDGMARQPPPSCPDPTAQRRRSEVSWSPMRWSPQWRTTRPATAPWSFQCSCPRKWRLSWRAHRQLVRPPSWPWVGDHDSHRRLCRQGSRGCVDTCPADGRSVAAAAPGCRGGV